MNYLDVGYDSSLLRPLTATYVEQIGIDSNSAYEQISGSQIKGDTIISLNGSMEMNLQEDRFAVSDGIVDRVELGRLSDGSIGLIIRDAEGNILIQISGNINIIQSPNQHFQLDFNEERILAKDEGGLPRALFGKGNF